MHRLHSLIDESLNREFDSLEEMQASATENQITDDDAVQEELVNGNWTPVSD